MTDDRPTLRITIGLPGSGKTTWARQLIAEEVENGRSAARNNRDDIRRMLYGRGYGPGVDEETVTLAQHSSVRELLTMGRDVVCDDTNLNPDHRECLVALATTAGATTLIVDQFLQVPVAECIRRDASRGPADRVGADVILAMDKAVRDA